MQRLAFAVLACLLGSATAALADCNPPPPGLSFDQWTNLCTDEIANAYQLYGGAMDQDYFIGSLYDLYQSASQGGGNGGATPMAACSPEGETQCNSSGWLYTCTNGQWLTGAVKCGG